MARTPYASLSLFGTLERVDLLGCKENCIPPVLLKFGALVYWLITIVEETQPLAFHLFYNSLGVFIGLDGLVLA